MTLQAKHDKSSLPYHASASSTHGLLDSLDHIHTTRDSEMGQLGGGRDRQGRKYMIPWWLQICGIQDRAESYVQLTSIRSQNHYGHKNQHIQLLLLIVRMIRVVKEIEQMIRKVIKH